MSTPLIQELRDLIGYSATERAADRLEKLERVLVAAEDYMSNIWCKPEVIDELRSAIIAAKEPK